jgi:hypothetical protein
MRADGLPDYSTQRVATATLPLFRHQGKRAPERIGSAVGLVIAGERFLLTAAHVLDGFRGAELSMVVGDSIVRFAAVSYSNQYRGASREVDEGDFGVIRMNDDQLPDVGPGWLTLAEVDLREWMMPSSMGMLWGYPGTRHKADVPQRRIKFREPFHYAGRRASREELSRHGRLPEYHVGIRFDGKRVKSQDGSLRTPPALEEMSGSGLWWVPQSDEHSSTQAPRLIAIFTDWKRQDGILLGSRIAYHLELIRANYPHPSPYIGTNGGPPINLRPGEPLGTQSTERIRAGSFTSIGALYPPPVRAPGQWRGIRIPEARAPGAARHAGGPAAAADPRPRSAPRSRSRGPAPSAG